MREKTFKAAKEDLDAVLDFITAETEGGNLPVKLQNKIKLAAEEIFVNISNYAYKPFTGSVTVRADAGIEFIIEFEDSGIPYNPLEKEDPDVTSPLKDRTIGGLGIFIAKKIMDSVEYRYENNKNILLMKKKIPE